MGCHFLLHQKSILSLKIDSEISLTQNSLRHLLLFLRNLLLSIRIPSEISLFTSEIYFLSEFPQNLLISSEFSQQSLFLPQKSASLPHSSLMNLPLFLINLQFSFRNLFSLRKFLYSVRISSEIFFFSEISFRNIPQKYLSFRQKSPSFSKVSLRNLAIRNLQLSLKNPSEMSFWGQVSSSYYKNFLRNHLLFCKKSSFCQVLLGNFLLSIRNPCLLVRNRLFPT